MIQQQHIKKKKRESYHQYHLFPAFNDTPLARRVRTTLPAPRRAPPASVSAAAQAAFASLQGVLRLLAHVLLQRHPGIH